MSFGIGQPVTRTEDPRLLTGRGSFVDNLNLPNQAYAAVVFSTVAHADIKSIDTAAAEAAPGVIAILTGAQADEDNLGDLPALFMPEDMGGPPGYRTMKPVMVRTRVRHVGERVALVIAETADQAEEAAELIVIDYDILPAVVRAADAIKEGAPQLYDGAANNVSFTMRFGDEAATDAAFAAAHHITTLSLHNNRLATNAMEPRSSIGQYSAADDSYTLYASLQNPHGTRSTLAQDIFHEPEAKFRVVARDVGGGFGLKGGTHAEDALVVWASKRVGRPVKWTGSRSASFLGDDQARDQTVTGELALDEDGKFLGLRVRSLYNAGAYVVGSACVPIIFSLRLAPSAYVIPAVDALSRMVLTNTPPTTPYRGAGRPEAIYLIERLIDMAARETGIDRIALRQRNFISPDAMPYTTQGHFTYDSGEFATTMEKTLALADFDGFKARRETSRTSGKRRGLGISYYIEDSGNFNERMVLRFDPSGSLTIHAGTFSHGQGHQTVYAQMVSDWLGIEFEQIRLEQGDTAQIGFGRGTYASRSMTVGGSALRKAADDVIETGRKFAAHILEAAADDIEFKAGVFVVAGTDKTIPLVQVARASFRPMGNPIELGIGLEGTGAFAANSPSFPNGCHICEVEIDPETGIVKLDRYAVVDDIGLVLNPLLAEGQIHGGIAQGIGQALCEDIIHDDNGQLLTGSYMDYNMPKADNVPFFDGEFHEVLCKTNPIGVKGCGEGGTVGATPTVINAILDALAPLGVTDIAMPATPNRVWKAIHNAI